MSGELWGTEIAEGGFLTGMPVWMVILRGKHFGLWLINIQRTPLATNGEVDCDRELVSTGSATRRIMANLPFDIALGWPSILLILFLAVVSIRLVTIVHLAFFTPRSRVPGPLLSKVTNLVDIYETLIRGRRSEWMHELHQQYGASRPDTLERLRDPDCGCIQI